MFTEPSLASISLSANQVARGGGDERKSCHAEYTPGIIRIRREAGTALCANLASDPFLKVFGRT